MQPRECWFFFKVGEQSALTDAELVGTKELYFVQFVPTPCCTLHRTCKTTCTFSREKPLMCTTWLHAFKQKAPCQRHVCTYKHWCDPCQNFVLCDVFLLRVSEPIFGWIGTRKWTVVWFDCLCIFALSAGFIFRSKLMWIRALPSNVKEAGHTTVASYVANDEKPWGRHLFVFLFSKITLLKRLCVFVCIPNSHFLEVFVILCPGFRLRVV